MNWLEAFFPYRSHLEREIEYLRAQLAQQQRRRDELEAVLAEIAKPRPTVKFKPELDGKWTKVERRPLGWDDYRANQRAQSSQVQSEEKGEQNARSNG